MRDAVARASAELKSRGDFDPARHAEQEPLNTSEHLEVLALAEVLARRYRHPARVHDAVQAGATWAQIAAATGTAEPAARQAYREWADRQNWLWRQYQGHFGLNDADHAQATRRAAEPDPEAGQ